MHDVWNRSVARHDRWRGLSNAAGRADEKRGWVRITHPFHPLRGQKFRLVVRRRLWGEERVVFVSPTGEARSVPVNWTDAGPSNAYEVVGRGRARVRVEDLLGLVELIDAGKSEQR
ncbi:MAG TPA: DUF5372 family protein [Terracidiphilus sp.]